VRGSGGADQAVEIPNAVIGQQEPPAGFPISLLVVDAFSVRLRVFNFQKITTVLSWPLRRVTGVVELSLI
jgi:hypothetical protein